MRRAFIRSSWVPPVLWGVTLLYLRPYDGWGAWAAAPLLLPSLLLSMLWGSVGAALLLTTAARDRRLDVALLTATFASAVVVLYYIIRYLLRS